MSLPSQAENDILFQVDVPMSARDGVILRGNIARPAGEGQWPVIVVRTPYSKDAPTMNPVLDPIGLAREGFVVVVQDVRGRFTSDGDFVPFVAEEADGADLIAWAAAQPFSTGDVFALGASYQGFAQWAAATQRPAALRAIAPHQSPSTPWHSFFFRGGVPELGGVASWLLSLAPDILLRRHRENPTELGAALTRLLVEIDALATDGFASLPLTPFAPLARHGLDEYLTALLTPDEVLSPLLQAHIAAQQYEQITVPALISGGWYDYFCQGAIDQFVGMRTRGGSSQARERTRLIIGPWTHAVQGSINGERNFGLGVVVGAAGRGGLRAETVRFFREQLGDAKASGAPVTIFVMGANVWRDEDEWPLARTQETAWYLASNGHANGLSGDGSLSPTMRSSPPDHFVYDPAAPVPTWGGNNLGATELAGPRDQRVIEQRADVLVYTSEVLPVDLEVTGSAVVELWFASSAPDTDVVARLVDVLPDGTAYNVAEGILRARYRHTPKMMGAGVPLSPNELARLLIELTPTSNVFKAGHRIRLDLTSSGFPRWARNLNIWEQHGATLAQAQTAHQTVLHDEAHPSRVILPIIPSLPSLCVE